MFQKYFVALTTEVQDGVFLVIGQGAELDFTAVFLMDEGLRDDVEWGDVVSIDMNGPKLEYGGDYFPKVECNNIQRSAISREKAGELMDKAAAFMEAKGWTEEKTVEDAADVVREMDAYFNIFPN